MCPLSERDKQMICWAIRNQGNVRPFLSPQSWRAVECNEGILNTVLCNIMQATAVTSCLCGIINILTRAIELNQNKTQKKRKKETTTTTTTKYNRTKRALGNIVLPRLISFCGFAICNPYYRPKCCPQNVFKVDFCFLLSEK